MSATRSTSTSSTFSNYAADDPGTKVIGFYIESIRNPRAFLDKAREVRRTKPIVLLKPGRTRDGAEASALHTGSLASDDEDPRRRAAPLRACARGGRGRFSQRAARAGDAAAPARPARGCRHDQRRARRDRDRPPGASGLELATFRAGDACAAMRSILPDWLEPANPFDFWIGIDVKGAREAHEVGLTAVLADPNVDLVLCTLLAPGNADFAEFGELMRRLRRDLR